MLYFFYFLPLRCVWTLSQYFCLLTDFSCEFYFLNYFHFLFFVVRDLLDFCNGAKYFVGPSAWVVVFGPNSFSHAAMQHGVRVRSGFSPTSLVEGAPDLFISATDAHQSNSSKHVPERLYTVLAISLLTYGPWTAGPAGVWITRDSPTPRVQVSSIVRACACPWAVKFFWI